MRQQEQRRVPSGKGSVEGSDAVAFLFACLTQTTPPRTSGWFRRNRNIPHCKGTSTLRIVCVATRSKTPGVITDGVSRIEIRLPNRRSVDQEPFSR